MKKKIFTLLTAVAVFSAVPAFAATPSVAGGQPAFRQDVRQLADNDNNDGWYCGRGYGRHGGPGCGRHDGSCWNNNQNQ